MLQSVWGDANVNDETIDFLAFVGGVATFEIVEDVQVLFWSEQIKQDVMLGTYTKVVSDLVHLFE